MLIDAERIEKELRDVDSVNDAELGAAAFHDPERLARARDDKLARLREPLHPRLSEEDLIAYALQRQEEIRKGLVS